MNGTLVLNDIKEINELVFDNKNDFTLEISVDSLNTPIDDIVLEILKKDKYLQQSDIDKMVYIFDNNLNIIDYIESVFLNFYKTDALEVIANNPCLQDKKIILSERVSFNDLEKLKILVQKYGKYADNIYVIMDSNDNYVNIKDLITVMEKFANEALRIEKLDLSPVEKLMYAYDKVRNGELSYDEEFSYIYKPQALYRYLSKDELLSIEYNNIFASLISFMDFNVFQTGLDITNKTLVKNFTYVNDPKYGIDGIYFFTLTWDKKCFDENVGYFNRYLGFLKTLNQFNEIEDLKYCNSIYEEKTPDIFSVVNKAILNDDFDTLINYLNKLNLMSRIITQEDFISITELKEMIKLNVINPKIGLVNKLKVIEGKFNTPIMGEKFIQILNRVRQTEYMERPDYYPYSVNDLYKASAVSGFDYSLDFHQAFSLNMYGEFIMPLIENDTERKKRFYSVIDELNIEEEIKTAKFFRK